MSTPGPLDVNFILQAHEVVENPEEDGISYLVVYINGEYMGETRTAAKSVDKFWKAELPFGNHLFRVEKWNVSPSGDEIKVRDSFQPRERFVRVEKGKITRVSLHFHDKGRRHSYQVTRRPRSEQP